MTTQKIIIVYFPDQMIMNYPAFSNTERSLLPLRGSRDLDQLVNAIGDARFVLLGEASHGTHEYYTWRAAITKRLISEKGFSFIAVEGDWPDCYRINRFIKGFSDAGKDTFQVLKKFDRWPSWMWANWEIAALVDWLRDYNKKIQRKVGFYGLDVYSLWESMEVMVEYLRKEDPEAATLAVKALKCFEPYGEEGHNYAKAVLNMSARCSEEVISLLTSVRRRAPGYDHDPEASLNAEMNARVIARAEEYYRSMVSFREKSWNIRDSHMADTLTAIMDFHGPKGKVIVWEHNTHVGDARFTDMKDDGLWNVGQLVREQHGDQGVFITGFAAYQGTVIAGRYWGAEMEKMRVPSAIKGSAEQILHAQSATDRIILFNEPGVHAELDQWLGHRAIGVVYHPESERGNYVPTLLPSRYDAILYFDRTTALHPMHIKPDGGKTPETYPFGF